MRLRVLTWNLFHGRAVPGAGRELYAEFAAALAAWEWDVALLQETPPWWPGRLAAGMGCEVRTVLTSRNGLLPVRRRLARRWPDVMRSGGGGCNAVLCRSDRVVGARTVRLCRVPESRWALGVELACGAWVGTLHASIGPSPEAGRDGEAAVRALAEWSAGAPVVLGGDFNLRESVSQVVAPGWAIAGSSDVDHVLVAGGVTAIGAAAALEHGSLSDHAPLLVELSLPVG